MTASTHIHHCIRYYALGLFLLVGLPTLYSSTASAQDWRLVWSDEFDQDGLVDPDKWSYQVGGGGWGNAELQFYTDKREENARVEGGHLIIEAIHEPFSGNEYTSARLRSLNKGDWLYGRVEVRARLPRGLGTWPAIWMLASESDHGNRGWPDTGEIDIMEAVGHDPGRTHSAVHTNALNHLLGNNPSATANVATSADEFHVYALEWTPTRITTFVDGETNLVYNRSNADWRRWPFDRPFHLLLNLAVGGTWGGAQGVDPNDFPAQFAIDYVRVFEDAAGPPVVDFPAEPVSTNIAPGSPFSAQAIASDPASPIISVDIFQQDGLMAGSNSNQTGFSVDAVHPGCYELRAVARDADGWSGSSDTLFVQAGDTCGQAPYLMQAWSIPGRIESEYFDLGGAGVAWADLSQGNSGTGIRQSESVDIGPSGDIGGGFAIEDVARREWVEYTVRVEEAGIYRIVARVAGTIDGQMTLSMDGADLDSPLTYASTSSSTFFRNASLEGVVLEEGQFVLRVTFDGLGTRLNWLEFERLGATDTERGEVAPGNDFGVASPFPNPTRGRIRVVWQAEPVGPVTVRVFDMLGRQVHRSVWEAHEGAANIDLSGMADGAYMLRVEQRFDRVWRGVVVQKYR
ncbi:MAG: hypothetical protein COV99_09930 [Bacteroidetes bacterium CG12_big_fil_rev_8_21_14_0_65_60_17]|nr:MAG: hypothetical protein COV99_09930 [Bacteroidetes bacterium CG12_big_fil_rev_8_21_14_0_65_60_17]